MTAASPWSVKGIDPKAREIAKDLARRSGMTLGDWLNQMIIEGGETEGAGAPAHVPVEPRRPLDELYREAQAGRRGAPAPRTAEEADAARLSRAVETLATRVEAAEQRSVLAISGIDQSVVGVLARLDEIEREQGGSSRLAASVEDVRLAQSKVGERLKRIEDADGGRAESLKALEAALGRMAMRLDEDAERAAAARAESEAGAAEARQAADASARRLEKVETLLEAAPAAYADAEKVETVLTRMAERLDETQTRTTAAVQSLQTSFAGLDARLRASEARTAGHSNAEIERRFQTLAQELSQRVDASRNELAQRLRAAAGDRLDKMETAIRELGGHVDQAERRSAQAIDRIGREVIRVAHSLNERVASAEHKLDDAAHAAAAAAERTDARLEAVEVRSATAVETMSGEVARFADAMENRLRHADTAQAEALEKLGGEIARIAERLAERISTSDRRSAEAIDEVTDKVSKIGARMDERQTASASELADRIRASEERTAKLLEEARERLDQRLAEVRRPIVQAAPTIAAPAPELHAPEAYASEPYAPEPYAPHAHAPAPTPVEEPPAAPAGNADPFSLPLAHAQAAVEPEVEPAAPLLHADPFARRAAFDEGESPFNPDDDFAPPQWASVVHPPQAPEPPATPAHDPVFAPASFEEAPASVAEGAPLLGFSVGDFAPAPEPALRPEQLSTREMLENARQAVRRAAAGKEGPPGSVAPPPLEPIGAASPRPFGITFPGRRKKEAAAPTLRTIALASITAGAITTMGVGAYLLGGGSAHDRAAAKIADMEPPPTAAPLGATPAAEGGPVLAAAVAPTSPVAAKADPAPEADKPSATKAAEDARSAKAAKAAAAAAPDKAGASASTKARFTAAVGRLDNGDLSALPEVRSAADAGLPAAQFYLARLYEAGSAGLPKDLSQARRWTQKAAEGGDASAMYNLASYLYAGDGGAKDPAGAASWFKRSAELGVVNGQYNLAQLYEKGYGVPQNTAEAYKWYLVAAGSGDTEAKASADSLKSKLAPAAEAAAAHSATSLRAQLPGAVQTAAAQP